MNWDGRGDQLEMERKTIATNGREKNNRVKGMEMRVLKLFLHFNLH